MPKPRVAHARGDLKAIPDESGPQLRRGLAPGLPQPFSRGLADLLLEGTRERGLGAVAHRIGDDLDRYTLTQLVLCHFHSPCRDIGHGGHAHYLGEQGGEFGARHLRQFRQALDTPLHLRFLMNADQRRPQATILQRIEQTTGNPPLAHRPAHQQHEHVLEQQVQRLAAPWRWCAELADQRTDHRAELLQCTQRKDQRFHQPQWEGVLPGTAELERCADQIGAARHLRTQLIAAAAGAEQHAGLIDGDTWQIRLHQIDSAPFNEVNESHARRLVQYQGTFHRSCEEQSPLQAGALEEFGKNIHLGDDLINILLE